VIANRVSEGFTITDLRSWITSSVPCLKTSELHSPPP
jgi:hypothetical protein